MKSFIALLKGLTLLLTATGVWGITLRLIVDNIDMTNTLCLWMGVVGVVASGLLYGLFSTFGIERLVPDFFCQNDIRMLG